MTRKSNTQPREKVTPGKVLAFLSKDGEWYSGEDLALRLGISRAAIAKHIAHLRRDGHVIESITNRGYRLAVPAEPMSRQTAAEHLETVILGRSEWRVLRETSSTNNEAIAWALAGAETGVLVTADLQTGGKGRKGHRWFSSPHALQFSLILRPSNKRLKDDSVMDAALEAIRQAVDECAGVTARIKKPNDLYVGERKIAGVLIESGTRAGEPDWLALGIGCNVNVPPDTFPKEIRDKVASLYEISGKVTSRNRLLAVFLNRLEARLAAFEPAPSNRKRRPPRQK